MQKGKLDLWMRDIAPSDGLRSWYGHDPGKWPKSRRRYMGELAANRAGVESLCRAIDGKRATFVFATRDAEHSSAAALKDFLEP